MTRYLFPFFSFLFSFFFGIKQSHFNSHSLVHIYKLAWSIRSNKKKKKQKKGIEYINELLMGRRGNEDQKTERALQPKLQTAAQNPASLW